jgi:hypothetical protein
MAVVICGRGKPSTWKISSLKGAHEEQTFAAGFIAGRAG